MSRSTSPKRASISRSADRELSALASRHGVSRQELINAALRSKIMSWKAWRDGDDSLLRDIAISRENNGSRQYRSVDDVVIPDEVLSSVHAVFLVDRTAAVHALLEWWNGQKPKWLPVATQFEVFGSWHLDRKDKLRSYWTDSPGLRKVCDFDGQEGVARAYGAMVDFGFHYTSEHGHTTIFNMQGDLIESADATYENYIFWISEGLRTAFENEWKRFAV